MTTFNESDHPRNPRSGRFTHKTTPSSTGGINRLTGPSANSGYVGYSMSRRAVQAYENGEMPKSKWTKALMREALTDYADDHDWDEETLAPLLALNKTDLFDRFWRRSSWHHTSKHFNRTDFYSLDEDALAMHAWNVHPPADGLQLAQKAASAHENENAALKRLEAHRDRFRLPYRLERDRGYYEKCHEYVHWYDTHASALQAAVEQAENDPNVFASRLGLTQTGQQTQAFGATIRYDKNAQPERSSVCITVPPGTWDSATFMIYTRGNQDTFNYLRTKRDSRAEKAQYFDEAQAEVTTPTRADRELERNLEAAFQAARELRCETERAWNNWTQANGYTLTPQQATAPTPTKHSI